MLIQKQYNKLSLQGNDIEMYSTYNEGKFVVAQRFISIWKNKVINTWLQYQEMCIVIN